MSLPETLVGGDLAIEPEKMQFPIGTTDAPIVQQAKAGGVTLDQILVHENFLTQFTVQPNAHAGAILWSQQIGPQQLVSRLMIGGQMQRQHTRVSLISSMYQYWCGDLKFRFRFTKTILQQCKLIACFIPGLRAGEAPPSPQLLVDYQFSTVMNPANECLGELVVPFISNANWLSVHDYTGRIVVGLVSPLVSSENQQAELPIMVTVSAGDMKFRSLVTPSRLEPEGDGGGGGGGGVNGSSDAPALFAESCSRKLEGRANVSGFLFSMESDASASEYTYALPLRRSDVTGASGGIAGFAERLTKMRPTNEASPSHAVLAPQATYANACPAFKRVCYNTPDSGLELEKQLELMPPFLCFTTDLSAAEMWIFLRVDSTRDMPVPEYVDGKCYLTAWNAESGEYKTWKPFGIIRHTSPGTRQYWLRIVVPRQGTLEPGSYRWSLDGIPVPIPSFLDRLTSELHCWSIETDEYESLLLYCTGPLLLNDHVRAHLLTGEANHATSVAVSFTTCQGARIFQGDRLGSSTRLLFKFFYNLFGGNPNSPWAKVCVVADRLCSFGLSLFLGYDGVPAPIPLTPETRMRLTTETTDETKYTKQFVTAPSCKAMEYNNKMELFFSKHQKRSEARRRRRQRKRAAAGDASQGENASNTEHSSTSDTESEVSVH